MRPGQRQHLARVDRVPVHHALAQKAGAELDAGDGEDDREGSARERKRQRVEKELAALFAIPAVRQALAANAGALWNAPDEEWNAWARERLLSTIDDLLNTPEPREPIAVVQRHVLYEFADPELENLSAGQKMLIRMGPQNRLRVKTKLLDLRRVLLASPERPG